MEPKRAALKKRMREGQDDEMSITARPAKQPVSELVFQSPAEFEELKAKHDALLSELEKFKQQSVQEANATFNNFKAAAEERFKNYDALVSQLQSKVVESEKVANELQALKQVNEDQRQEIESLKITMKKNSTDLKEKNEHATARMKHDYEQLIKLYSQASGIRVVSVEETKRAAQPEEETETPVEEDVLIFNCEQMGRNGKLFYSIVIPFNGEYYSYVPNVDKMNIVELELPDYLSEEIEFEKSMIGLFFWRVCDWLQVSN